MTSNIERLHAAIEATNTKTHALHLSAELGIGIHRDLAEVLASITGTKPYTLTASELQDTSGLTGIPFALDPHVIANLTEARAIIIDNPPQNTAGLVYSLTYMRAFKNLAQLRGNVIIVIVENPNIRVFESSGFYPSIAFVDEVFTTPVPTNLPPSTTALSSNQSPS